MLESALADALSAADYMVDQAKVTAFATGDSSPMGMVGGSVMATARASQINHHAEQYRHYTGWTYSIVRIIAQRIAGQPVRVARKRRSAEKNIGRDVQQKHTMPKHLKSSSDQIDVLEDHHFLQALASPNPIMVQWALVFVTIASLEITGKAHLWFFVNAEGKLEIWPLPSSWVEPFHTEDELYKEWLIRPDGMAAPMRVPGNQICMLGYPDPSNPLGQISPLQANARAVVTDEAIQEAQRRAFLNSINPGLALIVGRHPDVNGVPGLRPHLEKAQRQQIIQAIKQQYRGVVNWDEPLILDGLIEDAKKITMAPREMDFLQSAGLSKERLTQGWGVNPVSMGQLEGANRASSATADDHLCNNVINPKIVLVSQMLTRYASMVYGDPDLLCYFEEAHAVDLDFDLMLEQAMVDRAAMSRNEWRARHHMPPIEEGDSAFVPAFGEVLINPEPTKAWRGGKRVAYRPYDGEP